MKNEETKKDKRRIISSFSRKFKIAKQEEEIMKSKEKETKFLCI